MIRTQLILNRAWMRDGFEAYVGVRDHQGQMVGIAKPLEIEPVREATSHGCDPHRETFFLRRDDAQALMNELYRAGLRPDDAAHVNDTVNASKAHIADLREVAFSLLNRLPVATFPTNQSEASS